MASITTFEQLDRDHIKGDAFWRYPHVLCSLQRFSGQLLHDGGEVMVELQRKGCKKVVLPIPTSFRIGNRTMWNQTVFFVLGFSWFGPKAFDVTREDPTNDMSYMDGDHQNAKALPVYQPRQPLHTGKATHQWFMVNLKPIDKELNSIKALRRLKRPLTPKEENIVQRETPLQRERQRLIDQRERHIQEDY